MWRVVGRKCETSHKYQVDCRVEDNKIAFRFTLEAQNFTVLSVTITNRVSRVQSVAVVIWRAVISGVCSLCGDENRDGYRNDICLVSIQPPHAAARLATFIEGTNNFLFNYMYMYIYIYIYTHKVVQYIGPLHVESKFDGCVWCIIKNKVTIHKWNVMKTIKLIGVQQCLSCLNRLTDSRHSSAAICPHAVFRVAILHVRGLIRFASVIKCSPFAAEGECHSQRVTIGH